MLNNTNVLRVISDEQIHDVSFSQTALLEGQSLNYSLKDDIFLHVVVRPADKLLVLNGCTQGSWGEEFVMPLPDMDQQDFVRARLVFGAGGLDVAVGGRKAIATGRWKNPAEVLAIAIPNGITLELVPSASASTPGLGPGLSAASKPELPELNWLASVARGATFAEIGIFDKHHVELAFAAIQSGATQATFIDSAPLHDKIWKSLKSQLSERGLAEHQRRFKAADLADPYFAEQTGIFDVVVCRKLLQTQPDPFRALLNLRHITQKQCQVTAAVVPLVLEGPRGRLDLTDAGALFAPAMPDRSVKIVADYRETRQIKASAPAGPGHWLDEGAPRADREWWVMTAEGIQKIAIAAGFAVLSCSTDASAGLCNLALKPA